MAANDDVVKVLGAWPSPFVMRARIALNIKSVDYELVEERFGSKSELLLKSNPIHKKIPVLIHGDEPVCESLIIVEYIDEVWSSSGHPILPLDPYDRATARFWAAYIDDKWWPAMSGLKMAIGEEAQASLVKQLREGFMELEGAYNKISKGKDFFGGEKIGYLDITLGCFLGWVRATEKMMNLKLVDESQLPGLAKWSHKFCSHDSVNNVMPDTDKLVEVAKILIAKYTSSSK